MEHAAQKGELRMNTRASRRTFLQQGAAGGAFLLPAGAQPVPPNDTIQTIHGLRTTHGNFLDKPLPEPALETILQSSLRAANASNNQSYSIIVIRNRPMMKSVCGYQGSCLLLYCADYNRMKASAESLGYTYEPSTIQDFVTASTNTAIAAQTAVIAARSLGIDSLLTNGIHRGDMERLWKLLDLPQTHCFPVIALVLGYSTQEPAHLMGRLDGPGVIHNENYHSLTKEEVEEITRKYDDNQRRLGLNDNWAAQGHKHYLDWFFKEWMGVGRKPPEQATQMLRRLTRSRFIEAPKV
jgi:nitroreductase